MLVHAGHGLVQPVLGLRPVLVLHFVRFVYLVSLPQLSRFSNLHSFSNIFPTPTAMSPGRKTARAVPLLHLNSADDSVFFDDNIAVTSYPLLR